MNELLISITNIKKLFDWTDIDLTEENSWNTVMDINSAIKVTMAGQEPWITRQQIFYITYAILKYGKKKKKEKQGCFLCDPADIQTINFLTMPVFKQE